MSSEHGPAREGEGPLTPADLVDLRGRRAVRHITVHLVVILAVVLLLVGVAR